METSVNEKVPFTKVWKIFSKIDDNLYILYRHKGNSIIYTPMYIHSFTFIMGNDYKECEKYNLEITNPYELKNISDKLRYLRLKESMYQEDVAKMIGIDRTTYVSYETGLRIYPLDVMKKISDLYKIDLDALLDDYHNFIYNNQGQNIKSIRKELGISQKELDDSLGVSLIVIKRAEQEKVRFLEKNYIKLMNYYNLQKQLSV